MFPVDCGNFFYVILILFPIVVMFVCIQYQMLYILNILTYLYFVFSVVIINLFIEQQVNT